MLLNFVVEKTGQLYTSSYPRDEIHSENCFKNIFIFHPLKGLLLLVKFTLIKSSKSNREQAFWCKDKWRFNPLNANLTKWSNTLKQFVGCCRWIVWVYLTIVGLAFKRLKESEICLWAQLNWIFQNYCGFQKNDQMPLKVISKRMKPQWCTATMLFVTTRLYERKISFVWPTWFIHSFHWER